MMLPVSHLRISKTEISESQIFLVLCVLLSVGDSQNRHDGTNEGQAVENNNCVCFLDAEESKEVVCELVKQWLPGLSFLRETRF